MLTNNIHHIIMLTNVINSGLSYSILNVEYGL